MKFPQIIIYLFNGPIVSNFNSYVVRLLAILEIKFLNWYSRYHRSPYAGKGGEWWMGYSFTKINRRYHMSFLAVNSIKYFQINS